MLAAVIKFAMGLTLLVGIVAVPYFVLTKAWIAIAWLLREHWVWCILLAIPILAIAVAIWKWLYGVLGAAMSDVGKVVDRLEGSPVERSNTSLERTREK